MHEPPGYCRDTGAQNLRHDPAEADVDPFSTRISKSRAAHILWCRERTFRAMQDNEDGADHVKDRVPQPY